MRMLSLLSLIALLTLCTTSCTDQIVGEQIKSAEYNLEESVVLSAAQAPKVYVTSITPTCGKLGATASLTLSPTQTFSQVHVEIYSEAGFFIDRWTRSNPYGYNTLYMNIGTPPNGAKDCSILQAGTTYRVRAYGGNLPEPNTGETIPTWDWPSGSENDVLNTIKGCHCTF